MNACIISRIEDLDKLAKCHKKAFPSALASMQGKRFTSKMLEWYIVSERGILFHIEEQGEIVGYCGGIIRKKAGFPGAFTSITQYAYSEFVKAFLRKPWLVFHHDNRNKREAIMRNLKLRLGLKKAPVNLPEAKHTEFKPSWGLVVIGVIPEMQGKGYGSLLIKEFEKLAKLDGVDLVGLSVKASNIQAIKSYKRNGWIEENKENNSLSMYKKI